MLLTSIYRSNGILANVTTSQQLDRFMDKFSQLLSDLNATQKMSYVFLDSNINILNLHLPDTANYLNCIFSKGYLQIIQKATRIQNDAKSLIDHILFNSGDLEICSGTLISDLSDHFFTFVLPHIAPPLKQLHRTIIGRDFSNINMLEFKRQLNVADWNSVISKDDVDEAYDEFWTVYTGLFNQNFPLKKGDLIKMFIKCKTL